MHVEFAKVQEIGTIEDLEIDFSEGLNVISGPNEAGKSTLMRAIWLALTRRCTSKAKEIREIVPNSGGTPAVEVHVVADGTRYELEKVFDGQSGQVRLRVESSNGTLDQHTGEEADEVIREALGFGEASGRTGVPSHFGFWPAIWVTQDERHLDPGERLADEGDPESISSVLAQMGGDVLAGSGAEIVEQAREEYEKFFTDSGSLTTRSGAPLHEAKQNRNQAEKRFEELRRRQNEYEGDLDELGRLEDRLAGIDEQLPGLESEAEEAREDFQQVQALREELKTARSELKTAKSEAGRLEDRLSRRTELQQEIEGLEDDLEEKQTRAEELEEDLEEHRDERTDLKDQVEEAEEEKEALDQRQSELRSHLDVLRAKEKLEDVEAQADELQKLEGRRDELAGQIAEIAVDKNTIEELESQKEEYNEARTRLETASAQLRFRAQGDVDVDVAGETLSLREGEEKSRRIDEPTTLEVEDLLEIDVEPGGEDLSTIREAAREAKEEYESALAEFGAESVAEARSKHQRKQQLETELASVKDQISGLMPEEGSGLEEARSRFESQLSAAKEQRASYASDADGEDSPSGDQETDNENSTTLPDTEEEARTLLAETDDDLEEAEEALEKARESLQEHDEGARQLQKDLQKANTQAEGISESLSATRQTLEGHEKEHGAEEDLRADLEKAEEEVQEKEDSVEKIEAELEDLRPEDLKARKERMESALKNTKEERRELKSDLDKVRGRLESDDLRGLHGRLEEARQDLEEAQAEVDRLEQQADAAELLYNTLVEKRAAARQQYLAPLREEVEDLLGRFFGAERTTVEFGEEFSLETLSRSTDGSFEFDQLSAGAKQQLSVLVRLAMARLIAQERPHPVFLDDALSDTDPDRFEAIANILHSASQDLQIVLTTCHHERHRQLGVPTKRMEALKKEASREA
jgi:DNA repair exonuclease SbcCD ATPase subunit